MNIWTKSSSKFLYDYLNNVSPTGFETSGQKMWINYLKTHIDEWHSDYYGTAYGIINPGQKFKVVIEAHADEISWFVNYISDKGFIYVIRNGGSDHVIAPSKKVNIHTENGIVPGVFGWPAIHVRKGKNSNLSPTLQNIFIDVGATSKEEVENMGIKVGQVITFDDQVQLLNDQFYTGRALDNRVGGWVIAQVARLIKKARKKLPYSLYIVNAVQEEVGLRGAQMVVERIKPDIAICTDVCHDTGTPLMKPQQQGDIKSGLGPVLTFAPAVHHNVLKTVIDTADELKIPYQRSAASRSTGTDTDAFAYGNAGTPSILISLPLRYMHTTVEMAHKDDIENLIKLIYESLWRLSPEMPLTYY